MSSLASYDATSQLLTSDGCDVTKNSSARITQKCMLIFTDHLFMYIECVPWGYHLDVLSRGVWVDNLAGLVNNNNMSHMTCSTRHIFSDDIPDF